MGFFNTLICTMPCPACGVVGERRVQFKYGYTRQIEYRVGEILSWDGPEVGVQVAGATAIYGVSEDCPACRVGGQDLVIELDNDRFLGVVDDPFRAAALRRRAGKNIGVTDEGLCVPRRSTMRGIWGALGRGVDSVRAFRLDVVRNR